MGTQTTQPGVQVNSTLWQEFRDDVRDRKGVVKGHLKSELETAIREYINASHGGDTHDRLRNIETVLEELVDTLEEGEENKKDSGLSSTTEQRLRDIREQIREETDDAPKVHNEVVELAIREHAGGSDPTLRRYKRLLQQDRHLFSHPNNDRMYFRDPADFVRATNALRKGGKITGDTYTELVDQYGEGWWRDQLADDTITERGVE